MDDKKYEKTTIRFPADLYEKIKASAEQNRRSINSEILFLIENQFKHLESKDKSD